MILDDKVNTENPEKIELPESLRKVVEGFEKHSKHIS
jgi:hypothetical protein